MHNAFVFNLFDMVLLVPKLKARTKLLEKDQSKQQKRITQQTLQKCKQAH